MTPPREIATVTDTPALLGIVRARADKLGLSRRNINVLAELADGHAEKLLSSVPSKGLGLTVAWGLAEAVGLKFVLVEDDAAMARIKEFLGTRNESYVRKRGKRSAARMHKKARLERIFTDPKYFNKLARKGGRARAKSLSAQERSRSAMFASRARWKQERERRKQTRNAPRPVEDAVAHGN